MSYNQDSDESDNTSGNWNLKKPYSQGKLLPWLMKIDVYQTIAEFGNHDMLYDITLHNDNLKNFARSKALKRWVHAIICLIRNSRFAVKKSYKEPFLKHLTRLKLIRKNYHLVEEIIKKGNKIDSIKIREDLFDKITTELDDIMNDVNEKLNDSKLIFAPEEEIDISKIKDSLMDKYINRT